MIRLRLLGTVDLSNGAGVSLDAALRQSKRVALLAYLSVARPFGFHRRDKVAALFWPELSSERSRGSLRTTLSRLRDDFSVDLIAKRGADEIAIDSAQLTCDVREFESSLDAGRFDDAVTLYRGPFLDGVHVEGAGEGFEDWIAAERARLQAGLLRALASIGQAAEARGDTAGAIAAARQALDATPNDEPLARRLIGLLVASGNRGGAMEEFDEFVHRLRADHDVDPAAETLALVVPLRAQVQAPIASSVEPRSQSREATGAPSTTSARAEHVKSAPAPTRRSLAFNWAALGIVAVLGTANLIASKTSASATPPADPALRWHEVSAVTPPPPAAFGSRAILDSTGDAVLLLGGVFDPYRKVLAPLGESYWRLRGLNDGDAATWTVLTPRAGPRPSPRWIFGLSSDGAGDRAIVHGGALGFTSPCANDTWVLNHASAIGAVPSWHQVKARGTLPPAHADFDQVYDASRRRLIVFAGHDCIYPKKHETWVLSFDDSTLAAGTWSLLLPDSSAGFPGDRDAYAAGYDTTASRLFVYGGRSATVAAGDLWALDHASGTGGTPAWHPISCDGNPPVLVAPAGAIDFAADTWTFVGGKDKAGQNSRTVWRVVGLLRNTTRCRWEPVAFAEPGPVGRLHASAALLTGSRGMVMVAGEFGNTPLADVWVLRANVPRPAP